MTIARSQAAREIAHAASNTSIAVTPPEPPKQEKMAATTVSHREMNTSTLQQQLHQLESRNRSLQDEVGVFNKRKKLIYDTD